MSKPRYQSITPIERVGVPPSIVRPLYARFIHSSWSELVVVFLAGFLAVNVVFAALFVITGAVINGAAPRSFPDALSFSVQTFSTIGYGALSPGDGTADLLVALESFLGLFAVAMVTGVVFAKFALPVPGVLISDKLVIGDHEGQRCLMLRLANARGGDIVNATTKLTAVLFKHTREGDPMGKVYDLKLLRDEMPMLFLSWSVFHPIDEESPLYGLDVEALRAFDLRVYATVTGIDGTFMQTVYAYQGYTCEHIVTDARFVNMIDRTEAGGRRIDLSKINEVAPSPRGASSEIGPAAH